MRIISLTSIPPRFEQLPEILHSLAQQDADEVRLYIPEHYQRFPDWDGSLPATPDGVNIYRVAEDLGPATKALPACRDLWGQNAQILFCDDDSFYHPNWASRLFRAQQDRDGEAVAAYVRPVEDYLQSKMGIEGWRARQLPVKYDLPYRISRLFSKFGVGRPITRRPFVVPGYGSIFFGVCGVVVRPDFFDHIAFDIPPEAWPVDDVWLSANLARRGIRIYCPWMMPLPKASETADMEALLDFNHLGLDRQQLNSLAAEISRKKFGIWLEDGL